MNKTFLIQFLYLTNSLYNKHGLYIAVYRFVTQLHSWQLGSIMTAPALIKVQPWSLIMNILINTLNILESIRIGPRQGSNSGYLITSLHSSLLYQLCHLVRLSVKLLKLIFWWKCILKDFYKTSASIFKFVVLSKNGF